MRLGVVSAILGSMDFFEAVDCVSSLGYTCMEAACWPGEKADRRYAGVQHINVRALDKAAAKRISSYCTDRNVAISALAFYPNTMGDRPELVKRHIEHLKFVMDAAALARCCSPVMSGLAERILRFPRRFWLYSWPIVSRKKVWPAE